MCGDVACCAALKLNRQLGLNDVEAGKVNGMVTLTDED
jgi:hypothetical protein